MIRTTIALAAAGIATSASASDLLISGVLDGDLSGGTPKAIELYVLNDIADLSLYGFGSANNGGGTDGQELTLSGSATAGSYLYITGNSASTVNLAATLGIIADFEGSAANINGDDALELFFNGAVVDTYGVPTVNGDGETWDYTDSWAYRNNGTFASASFNSADWSFGGLGALDGLDATGHAATLGPIFGTYQVPAPGALALVGFGGLVASRRNR